MSCIKNSKPSVWYIAAGYKLPAGIEAYLLHYATEIRNQGFAPRIIVFEPLPKVPHRFLIALRERGIPIESLYESIASRAHLLTFLTFLPWAGRRVIGYWLSVIGGGKKVNSHGLSVIGNTNNKERITHNYSSLLTYWRKRLAVRELKRMIDCEKPDVIHVKGRLITEVWPVFPSERTIYQHALMGTRDPSWEDNEAEAFSVFLNRIAKVLVQGKGIVKTFAQAFDIKRPIEVVYTMAPDELAPEAHERSQKSEVRSQKSEVRSQKSEVAAGDCVFHIEDGECFTSKDTKSTKGEVRSQKSEGEGQGEEGRLEQKIAKSAKELGGGQRAEIRGQRTEDRGQKAEVRGQRSEVRSQKSEGEGQGEEGRFEQKLAKSAKEGGREALDVKSEALDVGQKESNIYGLGSKVSLLRFGILCRFTEQKGISYILEALKMFKEKHGAVDFIFAGQGPMEALIRASIETLDQFSNGGSRRSGVRSQNGEAGGKTRIAARSAPPTLGDEESNVYGPGSMVSAPGSNVHGLRSKVSPAGTIRIIPVDSAVNILRELDVFVHPGLDDAMPVSIVEALMCGVPCIVSNVGASPELVRDGVEGLVIEPASAEEIRRAMERFAGMTVEELAGFKTRARARYEAMCRPEVVGKQVAGIYREVMSDE